MKNDIEKQITNRIITNIETMDDVGVMNAAKEISALFKKFIEWSILHKELYIRFGDIDELFDFWQNLPEVKK